MQRNSGASSPTTPDHWVWFITRPSAEHDRPPVAARVVDVERPRREAQR